MIIYYQGYHTITVSIAFINLSYDADYRPQSVQYLQVLLTVNLSPYNRYIALGVISYGETNNVTLYQSQYRRKEKLNHSTNLMNGNMSADCEEQLIDNYEYICINHTICTLYTHDINIYIFIFLFRVLQFIQVFNT